MFGVSFATLKTLRKRIGVDQELALALWDTGNFDARNLAVKIADPARMSPSDLDRWAKAQSGRDVRGLRGYLAAEGPHARSRADAWLAAPDEPRRCCRVVARRRDGDARRGHARRVVRPASRGDREVDPGVAERAALGDAHALIAIGCRSAALRKSVTAAAKRIGKIEIDQGDTACKTPEVVPTLEKTWTYASVEGLREPRGAGARARVHAHALLKRIRGPSRVFALALRSTGASSRAPALAVRIAGRGTIGISSTTNLPRESYKRVSAGQDDRNLPSCGARGFKSAPKKQGACDDTRESANSRKSFRYCAYTKRAVYAHDSCEPSRAGGATASHLLPRPGF